MNAYRFSRQLDETLSYAESTLALAHQIQYALAEITHVPYFGETIKPPEAANVRERLLPSHSDCGPIPGTDH